MVSESKIADDGYAYNPAAQVQTSPGGTTLMPGVYRATGELMVRLRDGDPVIQTDDHGNEWPVYVIPSITVEVDGKEMRVDNLWHEIQTKPTNYGDTNRDFVSDGAIFLRALSAEQADSATSFGEAAAMLKTYVGQQVTFNVSTGLTARDTNWAKQEIARRNLTQPKDKKEINKVWRAADLKTANFVISKATKTAPAVIATTTKGPSGAMLTAKVKLAKFLPSNLEITEFGPGTFPPR